MKIVAISDTHNRHNKLEIPKCDLLLVAGDWTSMGRKHEVESFVKWLNKQDAKHIVVIPGNHEYEFEQYLLNNSDDRSWFTESANSNIHLLINEEITISGLKIYGSPVTPTFHKWAWNMDRGENIKSNWDKIPENLDILITHGPPYKILDEIPLQYVRREDPYGRYVGCDELHKAILRTKPKYHIFGHIHENNGVMKNDNTEFHNVTICDHRYLPSGKIHIIEIET